VQGPEKYLNELGLTVQCVVDPSRRAVLDVAHRAFVNYEAYYFCDESAMNKFVASPYNYTGKVTDPVTRERFIPTADSPSRSYGGRLFYFASAQTATTFDGDQMKFGSLMPGMREKSAQAN
jgi:YHS domain-containing protein